MNSSWGSGADVDANLGAQDNLSVDHGAYAHELRNEINFDQALDFWNQNGKIECLFLWKYSRLKEEESRKERNQMWPRFATSSSLRCSFCHKPKDQVEQVLAGARGVSICTTCVDGCQQVMRDASEVWVFPQAFNRIEAYSCLSSKFCHCIPLWFCYLFNPIL